MNGIERLAEGLAGGGGEKCVARRPAEVDRGPGDPGASGDGIDRRPPKPRLGEELDRRLEDRRVGGLVPRAACVAVVAAIDLGGRSCLLCSWLGP